MIYLWSASPGTGKTCYVVKQLIEKWMVDPKNQTRKIYHNINGLKIEGLHPIPDDFRECDDGSILIYDEAQDIEYYSVESRMNPVAKALSKHRHRGFDIHFITQDPALLNKWVLKNVYMHYYLWRPAQASNVTIYTFPRAIVSPTKTDFKGAYDKKLWRFEKRYLDYYTSTVLNTSEKVGSSKKVSILMTAFIFVVVGAYFIQPLFSLTKSPIDDVSTQQPDIPTIDQPTYLKSPLIASQGQYEEQDQQEDLEHALQAQQHHYNQLLQAHQLMQFERQQQLYQDNLPDDYQITKANPDLQVRAVIAGKTDCKAYNTHGDLMTLTKSDCSYYLEQTGRVHRGYPTTQTSTLAAQTSTLAAGNPPPILP